MAEQLVSVSTDDGVCVATIDAPPINVMTLPLFRALFELAAAVEDDDSVRVLVLRSANPDFFIAHFDVEAILMMSTDGPAIRPGEITGFHLMCERFRTMDKVTIAEIAGRVGGGGAELAASCDMRFGALGKTVLNQMEVPIGILPGGTGTQRIPRLVGRGRAMEIVLGGVDIDAETADRWGWLNRALAPDQLTPFVDALARRIAGFPPAAVAAAKQSVLNAERLPLVDGLFEEQFLFQQLLRTPEAHQKMQAFLEAGGQTGDGELRVADLTGEL
ncbi:MAG: enoyl-CoA hydratase/isomerase family protein [Acidimicrobiia bacterium]|nr:enoyl-CoA hydratase/isomerase family protein [Acidimicrobiia bacterium]